MKRPKCYVSSLMNSELKKMWRDAQKGGADIRSVWIHKEDEDELTKAELGTFHAVAEQEIRLCDRFVLLVRESDFPLTVPLVQVGMALALGKLVYVVATTERAVFMLGHWTAHPSVIVTNNLMTALYD